MKTENLIETDNELQELTEGELSTVRGGLSVGGNGTSVTLTSEEGKQVQGLAGDQVSTFYSEVRNGTSFSDALKIAKESPVFGDA